jgi:hypothetical protein
MDEAPGVADPGLIFLNRMLVCSTASGQDVQRIIHKKRLVLPSQVFRRPSSCTATDRGEAVRFRLLPRSPNGTLYDRDRPALAAAFWLSRHSPGACLAHDRRPFRTPPCSTARPNSRLSCSK